MEADVTKGNRNNDLVQQGTEEKGYKGGHRLGVSAPDQREVQVAHHPKMHRNVPVAPVGIERARVPPVLVELPVSELSELCKEVQVEMEEPIEAEQPDICVWN